MERGGVLEEVGSDCVPDGEPCTSRFAPVHGKPLWFAMCWITDRRLVHAVNLTVYPLEWFTAINDYMKFYYVYVLLSLKDSKFYIGFTNNLKRRFNEHQKGENISTSKRLPVRLIFYEAFLSKEDTRRRERYFKTAKGKNTLKQMLRDCLKNR